MTLLIEQTTKTALKYTPNYKQPEESMPINRKFCVAPMMDREHYQLNQ